MAGSLEINDPNATVSFVFTDTIERVQNIVESAAGWFYMAQPSIYGILDANQQIIPFDYLTVQQKVDVVNKSIAVGIREVANNYKNHLARIAQDADDTIGLGE